MGLADVGRMSLGEYFATCRWWSKAHDKAPEVVAPTEDEFERATLAARGIA